jgi:hypothetical protein
MRLISKFQDETDTHIWMAIIKNLHLLSKCLLESSLFDKFKSFLNQLFKKITNKIGFEPQSGEGNLMSQIKWVNVI